MTIAMPDSITPGNMPMGFAAYLGYCDGRWPTAPRLPALFPGAKIVSLTVTGATDNADGCDQETGDLGPSSAAMWLKHQLLSGRQRPVLYASRDSVPLTLSILAPLGVGRSQLRILSAHYTGKPHICSPAACGASFTADGTQWTSQYPGLSGSRIDMSCLADDFFGAPAPSLNWTEKIVQQLPTVSQGATGNVVRTVQGLCAARGHAVTVDGVFGPATLAAVKAVQSAGHVAVDGVVGPQTWPVLLGV